MVEYVDLGYCTYESAERMQRCFTEEVAKNNERKFLIFAEFPTTITYTKQSSFDDLLVSREELLNKDIALVKTPRGGHMTMHSRGQLVCYLVLNIKSLGINLHNYLRDIELIIMNLLDKYGLNASRKEGYTGVWIEDEKVCAIGLHVKNWISNYGFALNIETDLKNFDYIIPCGIREFGVCSLRSRGIEVSLDKVKKDLILAFERLLGGQDESGLVKKEGTYRRVTSK